MRPRYWPCEFLTLDPTILSATNLKFRPGSTRLEPVEMEFGPARPHGARQTAVRISAALLARKIFIKLAVDVRYATRNVSAPILLTMEVNPPPLALWIDLRLIPK